MKVSFWVSSRRARVGASEAGPTLARLELTQKLTFIQTVKALIMLAGKRQVSVRGRRGFSLGFFFTGIWLLYSILYV